MADKQIIYDVCPYQGECSISGCKRNDDGCFVRQLFEERDRAERELYRKEQECDLLKEQLEAYKMEAEEGKEINAELKAENEELKEARKNSRCAWKSLEGTFCPEVQAQLDQLKQAIARIKELIQKEINDCEHWDDCASCEYNCCIRQAMQICDEVISE